MTAGHTSSPPNTSRSRRRSGPKVALIFPEVKYPSGQPPLGLAYLAAWLEQESDARVEVIDLSPLKDPFGQLERKFREERYDVVGVSVVTPHLREARRAAALSKRIHPSALVVFGGAHPTVLPESVLEDDHVDLVCLGESELTFAEVIEAGGPDSTIPGIAYRTGTALDGSAEIIRTGARPWIEDLDRVPMPARHLMDMEAYFTNWYSMDAFRPGLRGTPVIASRGCPYHCTFCQPTISSMFGKGIRKRSPENVVDELQSLKTRFGIEAFMFEDSLFLLDKQWVTRICDLMLERDLGLLWCCNIRGDLASREMLLHMKEAGLRKVNVGVESAVPRILDEVYEKGESVEAIADAVRMAKGVGLKVQGYFMMGAYSETREEIEETIRFAVSMPFDDAVFDITTPFPCTTLYDRTFQHIDRPFEDFDCFHVSVYRNGDGLSGDEIARLKKRAYYRFYFRPRRLVRLAGQMLRPVGFKRTMLKMRRV